MEIGTLIIILIILIISFKSFKNRRFQQNKYPMTCFIDKLLIPFSSIYQLWHPNDILNIDYVGTNSLAINTEAKHLYGLEIKDFKNLDEELIYKLYKTFSSDSKGFFYQAILKDSEYQKQYIFSYSKELIEIISQKIEANLLTGEKSLEILKKLVFIDSKKKKLDINISLKNKKDQLTSKFEVYQGYKAKEGHIDDVYQKLKNTHITGVIWGYYDFYQGRVAGYLSTKLKDYDFFMDSKELAIINFILISNDITKEQINQISNIYNISLVKKSINGSEIIQKTPLKHRDVDWDLLVNLDYLSNQFIAKG